MLEFKTTQELKPNPKLLELIKTYTHKTKNHYFTSCYRKWKVYIILHSVIFLCKTHSAFS